MLTLKMELDPNEPKVMKHVRVVVGPMCPSHEFVLVRTSDRDYIWVDTQTGEEFAVGPKGKHLRHSHQCIAVERLWQFYGDEHIAWYTDLVHRLHYGE